MNTAGTGSVESPELVFQKLYELMKSKYPVFSDILLRDREQFGEEWVRETAESVRRLFGPRESGQWEAALSGYVGFSLDAMRNQKFFEKNGRYRFSSLSEIQRQFYENEAHMLQNYLPGMFLSHFLWPHHHRMLRFYRAEVLGRRVRAARNFFDVGIGTGFYSLETLRALPEIRGTGLDISRYSVLFTESVLSAFDVAGRYRAIRCNVFEADLPWGEADFVVCQEVLEHLEDPGRLCGILFKLCRDAGVAYITAAVTAGHSDHIYLFRSPGDVAALLAEAGWSIETSRAEYAYEGKPIEVTPCVVGFVCRKL